MKFSRFLGRPPVTLLSPLLASLLGLSLHLSAVTLWVIHNLGSTVVRDRWNP